MPNPYEILGVSPGSSIDEIKKAFKTLAMTHHPDKGGDPEKFKEINNAYQMLTNPPKEHRTQGGGFRTENFHFDLNNIFDNEIFKDAFRQAGFNFRAPNRNRQVRVTAAITLEEAFTGCEKTISIRTATGKEKILNCKIPPGIEHGQTISYQGIGDDSIAGSPAGDLLITVQILRHPTFDRIPNSPSLVMSKKIDVFDAILGSLITITTIDNKTLKVSIPRGTQPGTKIKLTGMGMQDINNNRGDLFVIIEHTVPNDLTEEQLKKLDEIRKMR